jgi:hypothetical protein
MRAPFSPVFYKHKARTPAAYTFLPLDACLTKFVKKEARKRKKTQIFERGFPPSRLILSNKEGGPSCDAATTKKPFFAAISCHAPTGYLEFINFNVLTKKEPSFIPRNVLFKAIFI